MTHVLIVGMTESGKTTLARNICADHMRKGTETIVLDPMCDPRWHATFQTADPELFLDVAARSQSCALFLDESGDTVGRYNDEMFWLATKARHFGHRSHFVSQRAMQLNKTVRDQCRYAFVFCVSRDDAKMLSNEYGHEELVNANTLGQFECYFAQRFGGCERLSIREDFT